MVTDKRNRPMRDLRISVTDRCSFRCGYCMPREIYDNHEYLERSSILTYGEIRRITRLATDLGVRKVRLTGGEPLLRSKVHRLVEMLASIDEVEDLAMTTNALLLAREAERLKEAGLDRVTVSLDAIDDDLFRKMIDTDVPVAIVFEAIDVANDVGLDPIKINTVVRRGWNEDEVVKLVDRFRGTGHTVRFIEFMDVGTTNSWNLDEVVPSAELVDRIAQKWEIEPLDSGYRGEVASRYRFTDGGGEVGFISSVSSPFCGDCTRLRLSAEGKLYTCLFGSKGTDLRTPLRSDASDDEIRDLIEQTWVHRDDRYSELRGGTPLGVPKVEMSYIGG
ncbi:MAG: GTP 3',8-cyclase MoaA [Actinomycetota bacterium]|nr:GTP 3',8-cyclase MoaA [Actinomycetota bacterium]MDK1037516.1 GTP 3',8-cyclase MoaA [Actinomycetota bacterium]MDK1095946.1 GTP 3',8-cyclase MoaA [Actinomycetota bacterium]MDK1104193.1 GTP 3',8-cyclase MoaA [Actinomycetota bacterium]MDK1292037.1 GTP 3',8-cyclase MoaA [Actinomycetota bacterium]